MFYRHYLKTLKKYLDPNKVVIIQGPRQVGKTTLVKEFLKSKDNKYKYKYVTGDSIEVKNVFASQSIKTITSYVQGIELLVIDEAQKIDGIGLGLKILVDQVANIRVIVTGSASFDLVNKVGEPLVGRAWRLNLFPLSQLELKKEYNNEYEQKQDLSKYIVYGSYPEVLNIDNIDKKRKYLDTFVDTYLLKDVLQYSGVKGSKFVLDLLKLIAHQTGSLVSLTELANTLEVNKNTIKNYLDLLEKTYIITNLRGFSRNLRNEVTKTSKYYFYDTGILNSLTGNFNDLKLRNDKGALWENFLVMERLKKQEYKGIYANNYFWRTWERQEIDFIEDRGGKLHGYEFKYSPKKVGKAPKLFLETYKNSSYEVVNSENYINFVT